MRQFVSTTLTRHALSLARFIPLPAGLLRRAAQSCFLVAAVKDPKIALRCLLIMDKDLEQMISHAAIRLDGGIHAKHRLMRYHDFFTARVGIGDRVLDIGCGHGSLAFDLAAVAAHVTGVDLHPDHIAYAKAHFRRDNLSFVHGDATRGLPDGQTDVVVLSNVLEHIEDRSGFLATVSRTANPGRYLIRVPMYDRHWHVPLREELGLFPYSDATHFTEYTRDSFEREMAAAGLHITELIVNWGEIWCEAHPC